MNPTRQRLVRLVRSVIHPLGVDVVPFPKSHHLYGLVVFMNSLRIDRVLDVGANQGQYAEDIRTLGYSGTIHSFEPVTSAFAELSQRAEFDPLWQATRSALGREKGVAQINVAANGGASSSLLPMLDRHSSAAPEADYVRLEQVPVSTLDDIAADPSGNLRTFLKVDTQGYELAVLDGAAALLGRSIMAVQLELSLVPLYDGAPLYDEMLSYMSGRGFRLCWLDPGFHDPTTYELLQFDACFVKNGMLGNIESDKEFKTTSVVDEQGPATDRPRHSTRC